MKYLVPGLIALALILLVVSPMFTIWALNILFGLTIELNFYTWMSALWLGALVYGVGVSVKK